MLNRLILLAILTGAAASGCNDSCAELEEICALCPADGLGPTAKESCLRAVETDDDHTCSDAVDEGTYRAFGCK